MIDLRSDTVTQPTLGMREAMARAPVGDDVFGEDPTVNAFEARVADLFGKEAGLFVPSGTMANQIAIRAWTQPGDEVILEANAHPFHYEAGGAAVISGVTIRLIEGDRGIVSPEVLRAALRPPNVHHAPATLFSVENTANRAGGTPIPAATTAMLCAVAREAGLRTHLDGARIWNAEVADGAGLRAHGAPFDSVNVCFSKALGAPVGSMLLGPSEMIARCRRIRKMLGGGMRQVGVLAAACDYALDHHWPKLGEDHRRADALRTGLRAQGWHAEGATNMVYVITPDAPGLATRLQERGVRTIALGWDRLRLVTHFEIDDAAVGATLLAFGSP